ncbi:hypothetical protein MKZ38_009756 [Zalerion maritima]|uniref:ER membrane protein complex subunit 7 beta-sandwich domain-containing protein n=1 Tax=Zalerion maritima TaxID=339359 RepID=A0AAD5WYD7_9PEZI|nr:hypothetical protein MKZ38_009756 [Zalerion maritima]
MYLSAIVFPFLSLLASAADVSFYMSPSNALPNPRAALTADTHATLTTLNSEVKTAPINTINAFVFHNVTPGSYLVDFHSRTHGFNPIRLDVTPMDGNDEVGMKAWETYRGNDWENKGEAIQLTNRGFEARCLGFKNYFTERQGFSVMTILKNPMILMGLVSMGLFFGMPKLMENMDPEMRAEFEEQQKKGPMAAMMGGASGQQQAASPLGDFDLASYLSGQDKKKGNKEDFGKKGRNRLGRHITWMPDWAALRFVLCVEETLFHTLPYVLASHTLSKPSLCHIDFIYIDHCPTMFRALLVFTMGTLGITQLDGTSTTLARNKLRTRFVPLGGSINWECIGCYGMLGATLAGGYDYAYDAGLTLEACLLVCERQGHGFAFDGRSDLVRLLRGSNARYCVSRWGYVSDFLALMAHGGRCGGVKDSEEPLYDDIPSPALASPSKSTLLQQIFGTTSPTDVYTTTLLDALGDTSTFIVLLTATECPALNDHVCKATTLFPVNEIPVLCTVLIPVANSTGAGVSTPAERELCPVTDTGTETVIEAHSTIDTVSTLYEPEPYTTTSDDEGGCTSASCSPGGGGGGGGSPFDTEGETGEEEGRENYVEVSRAADTVVYSALGVSLMLCFSTLGTLS